MINTSIEGLFEDCHFDRRWLPRHCRQGRTEYGDVSPFLTVRTESGGILTQMTIVNRNKGGRIGGECQIS